MMVLTLGLLLNAEAKEAGQNAASFATSPRDAQAEAMGYNMSQFSAGVIAMLNTLQREDPAQMTALMAAAGAGPWIISATPNVRNESNAVVVSPGLTSWISPSGTVRTPDSFLPRSYSAIGPWQVAVYPDNPTDRMALAITFADPNNPAFNNIKMGALGYGAQMFRELSATSGVNNNGTLVNSVYMDPGGGAQAVTADVDNIPSPAIPDGAAISVQCFSNAHIVCQ